MRCFWRKTAQKDFVPRDLVEQVFAEIWIEFAQRYLNIFRDG